jgi:Spy/CpxP family protein refolding chaperone
MHRKILLLLLGLTLAGTSWAWAQPGQDLGGGFQDRLLEVKRTQLGPTLGVNQQTVDKLLAIDQRYKPMRSQLILGMQADMRRLQQLMSQAAPPEQEVKALLADMKRKRMEMLNLQQRKDEEESAVLTPMQQARYIMYLMTLLKEARNVKQGGGRNGGMGSPALRPPREIPVSRPSQPAEQQPAMPVPAFR